MGDYISREEAIKELCEVYENEYPTASGDFDEYASRYVPNVLRNMQAADVQPVKHGRWVCEFYNDVFDVYQADCSVCKKESTDKYDKVSESYEYCPHCGTRMNSDANE